MLINKAEYQAMYNVEAELWWYKILHGKVLKQIDANFKTKEIKVLDAGCGTGGMLDVLKRNGFTNISGFDYNPHAVEFTNLRGFAVDQINILKVSEHFKADSYDVIVCNDVMYQFEETEIIDILNQLLSLLKPNGVLITNNNAFEIFRGTHDIAVGSKKRFQLSDFKSYIDGSNVSILNYSYWSFFLSPLILVIRLIQKLQLKLNLVDLENIKSDVALPSKFMNSLFYNVVKIEDKISNFYPFGSSMLLIFRRK